mmetsp:Transcript_57884/g.109007  ORF Transcript_57884/g.109007 Transcript_57884/m.109007 type:complete len:122 (+) Transcript_57884:194-559(+)
MLSGYNLLCKKLTVQFLAESAGDRQRSSSPRHVLGVSWGRKGFGDFKPREPALNGRSPSVPGVGDWAREDVPAKLASEAKNKSLVRLIRPDIEDNGPDIALCTIERRLLILRTPPCEAPSS